MRKARTAYRAAPLLPLLFFLLDCAGSRPPAEDIFWPSPPEPARIKYLRSISSLDDLDQGWFQNLKSALLGRDRQNGLLKPYGVAVDSRGRIFVSDAGNRSVLVFNEHPRSGEKYLEFLGTGGAGQLIEPAGVAVGLHDEILVSDVIQRTVYEYGPDLQYRRTLGQSDTFTRPAGIAVNPGNGNIIILDAKAHNFRIFTPDGEELAVVGGPGTEPGRFNIPTHVACDTAGRIYVVDSMNFRVQLFSPAGEYLSSFGQADNVPGSFSRPKGIALDSEGHVYVADSAFDNIQIFTPEGTLLLFFGSAGTRPGYFQLPAGICFDRQDRLFVVDQYNRRIQIFQYLKASTL